MIFLEVAPPENLSGPPPRKVGRAPNPPSRRGGAFGFDREPRRPEGPRGPDMARPGLPRSGGGLGGSKGLRSGAWGGVVVSAGGGWLQGVKCGRSSFSLHVRDVEFLKRKGEVVPL